MSEGPLTPEAAADAHDLLRRAGRLGAICSLESITATSIVAKAHNYDAEPPYSVTPKIKANWERPDESPNTLAFVQEFGIPVLDSSEDLAYELEVTVAAVYWVPADFSVDEQDARAFSTVTVLFTVYPYVRELVNNLSFRLGFPPFVMDTIKAPFDPSSMVGPVAQSSPLADSPPT